MRYRNAIITNKCLIETVLFFLISVQYSSNCLKKNLTEIKPYGSVDGTEREAEGTCNGLPGICRLAAFRMEAEG